MPNGVRPYRTFSTRIGRCDSGWRGVPYGRRVEPRSGPTEREVVDEMFMGEVVGTAVLILIGDGVVAGVL